VARPLQLPQERTSIIHHTSLFGDVGNDTTVSRTFAKPTLVIDPFIPLELLWQSSVGGSARPDLDGKGLDISQQTRIPLLRVLFLVSTSRTQWARGRCATAMAVKSGSACVPPSPTDVGCFGRRGKPSYPCRRLRRRSWSATRNRLLECGLNVNFVHLSPFPPEPRQDSAEAQRLSPSIERQSEWSFASRSYFVRALLRSLRRTRPVIAARDKGRRAR